MQCDQCGTILPRDDVRFCANCGAMIVPHERKLSPPVNDDSAALSSAPPKRDLKKPLREQLARQPSTFSSPRQVEEKPSGDQSVQGQLPERQMRFEEEKQAQPPVRATAGGNQFENDEQSGTVAPPPGVVKPRREPVTRDVEHKRGSEVNWPVPLTHIALNDKVGQEKETPKRELHVKVWKQPDLPALSVNETASPPAPSAASALPSPAPDISVMDDLGGAEDQPTRPLGPSDSLLPAGAIPVTPAPQKNDSSSALEQIDTMQLMVQPGPGPQSHPMTPLPQSLKPVAQPRRPWMLFAVLFLILIIAGLSVWIGLAQPFSVSPVTKPWQSYNDASLGMSFVYPNDWSQQVDRNKSIVQFNDSSHTAQVSVAVSNASSVSLNQFAQQQAKQFGLTTTKAAPTLSFGGATWQQVQGNTQISGANYSGRVLFTTHGNRHYVIVQLAPLDTYSDEEKVIFLPMHASWKFHS